MITFSLYNLTAMGSAIVSENGDTLQKCIVETKIEGIISNNKILTDVIDFIVPNSVMVGSSTPTVAGWDYIKNTLAPQWVADNYQAI
jgi:hypothetical protein